MSYLTDALRVAAEGKDVTDWPDLAAAAAHTIDRLELELAKAKGALWPHVGFGATHGQRGEGENPSASPAGAVVADSRPPMQPPTDRVAPEERS